MTEWIVTSSALILIVIALRGLLKGKISLKLQYGLWALVLVRLLLPFSIADSAISIANILSVPSVSEADNALTDYKDSMESIRNDYIQRGESVTNAQLREQALQSIRDKAQIKLEQDYAQTGAQIQTPQIQEEIRQQAQQQASMVSSAAMVTDALPYLWLAGVLLVGAVLIGSNLHFAWKLRKSRKELDLPHVPAKVYLTDYVATPCLFGIGKPDIYLTNEVMEDSLMRSHVLAHEMSHYRQGDHIWSVLRCACLVLHWYNPLVWVAAILSKQDAELACDEATIKTLGETERTAYGRTLIGMTCVRKDPRSLMLTATTMLGTKKTLKERILLIAKKPRMALYTLVSCILVAAIAVGCTFTGPSAEPDNLIIEPTTEPSTEPTVDPTEPSTEPFNEPTEPSTDPTEPNPEIQKFQDLFNRENNYWYWRALGCLFAEPEELSLNYLVYNGYTSDEQPDRAENENEIEFMKKLALDTWDDESVWVNTRKISRTEISEVLMNYYGLNLDDVSIPDQWAYFEETDSYYCISFDGYGISNYTVTDVETWDNGIIYVYWTSDRPVLDTRCEVLDQPIQYLENPQMVMALREKADGSYLVLLNMPEEELFAYSEEVNFQDLFNRENNYWYWRALGCIFDAPDTLDLEYLFYNGLPDEREENQDPTGLNPYTDSEMAFLKAYARGRFGDESVWVNAHKLPREAVNDVLLEYFGANLNTVSIPEDWVYFEETDSYYTIHLDAYGIDDHEVVDVQYEANGFVWVYWVTTDWILDTRNDFDGWLIPLEGQANRMVMLLLERKDGTYDVLSNQPVEPEEPFNPVPRVIDIKDRTEEENLTVGFALELFFMDAEYRYYFSGIKSQYITVYYDDGSSENIITALQTERATIADLDTYRIRYIKNPNE